MRRIIWVFSVIVGSPFWYFICCILGILCLLHMQHYLIFLKITFRDLYGCCTIFWTDFIFYLLIKINVNFWCWLINSKNKFFFRCISCIVCHTNFHKNIIAIIANIQFSLHLCYKIPVCFFYFPAIIWDITRTWDLTFSLIIIFHVIGSRNFPFNTSNAWITVLNSYLKFDIIPV